MNAKVMFEVLMSAIFFAPLLIAFGFFVVVGLMAAFEAVVGFAAKLGAETDVMVGANASAPGPIVTGLTEAVADEATAADTKSTTAR